ncbi:MAG: hydrogen gas-evolving membrane-bound hydrogenase subunit E [Candidatus Aerophobetes bacterium]|nr:hydrogen gas-evolving membrane-bound hydrogenase subunit E [Candidatus Aerophobetes bacterium]
MNKKGIRNILILIIIMLLGIIFFSGFHPHYPLNLRVSEHYITKGEKETGAINIVSSIYLGYRAFDTLGETIALLVTVSSIVFLLEKGGEKYWKKKINQK